MRAALLRFGPALRSVATSAGRAVRTHPLAFKVVGVATTAVALGTTVVCADDQFLGPKSTTDTVKYNYELRIRLMSSPEKIFELFASTKGSRGDMRMTPYDLMLALTPAASHFKDQPHIPPGPEVAAFFEHFGAESSSVSFHEYLVLITLLAVPETEFMIAFKMFDTNGDGVVDTSEFVHLMKQMRDSTASGQQSRGGARSLADMSKPDQWEFEKACRNITYFFGRDGKNKVTFPVFQSFMNDLRATLTRLEFNWYRTEGSATIAPQAFALSVLGHASLKDLPMYFNRVRTLDKAVPGGASITFEKFQSFDRFLSHVDLIDVAIRHYEAASGAINREALHRAARAVAGIQLDNDMVEILFHLFDHDGSGTLEAEEFTKVFRRKKTMGLDSTRSGSGVLKCFMKCAFPP